MWALDDAWALLREDVPHLDRPPSEVLREHLWFTTQPIEEPADPARHGDRACATLGMDDRIMFASDYPHWDFDAPPRRARAALPGGEAKIMGTNACRLYGLPERVHS